MVDKLRLNILCYTSMLFVTRVLKNSQPMQLTCSLLTLWFEHGEEGRVYDSLIKGLKLINIENWLQVIPQLIARIDTNRQRVGKLIHTLLCDISKHHPQVCDTTSILTNICHVLSGTICSYSL